MRNSKKYLAWFASAGFVVAVAAPGHAFTSIKAVAETASVTVGGGATSMSVALLNADGSKSSGPIGWSGANVGSGWLLASQHLQITSQMSQGNGAYIQTYTDNTSAGASPKYTGVISSVTASPAGLINAGNTALAPLPSAWQINASTTAIAPDDPNHLTGTGYAWFYHEDKAQVKNNQGVSGPFVNGAPYVEAEIAGNPPNIQFAQGSFGAGAANGVNNMFIEANFLNSLGGATYGTNTLTVELATP